uniref:Uncharacterized protein n=1 Tax=Anopheles christyi TaxID=43041 RepID=A0A182KAA4_9DIPT
MSALARPDCIIMRRLTSRRPLNSRSPAPRPTSAPRRVRAKSNG